MCSRTRRRPSSALPALHALQLRRLVQLDNAIDLAIWMLVVLAQVFVLAFHVHRRDAQVLGIIIRQSNLAASVLGPDDFMSALHTCTRTSQRTRPSQWWRPSPHSPALLVGCRCRSPRNTHSQGHSSGSDRPQARDQVCL